MASCVDSAGSNAYDSLSEQRDVLAGGEAPKRRNYEKRRNTVEFHSNESPSSATSVRSFRLIAVETLQNLKDGEELCTQYGNNEQITWYKVK